MSVERILAIDYGRRRVGFAVSDPLGLTAQPLETYQKKSDEDLVRRVKELAEGKQATKLLLGLPLNMDGSKGPMAEEVEALAEKLRRDLDLPIDFWDERLTSWQAEELVAQAGLSKRKQREKGNIDRMAAQIMLQSYLEAHR